MRVGASSPFHKTAFPAGKRVAMLRAMWPAAHAVALPAGVLLAALALLALFGRGHRRARAAGSLAPLAAALGSGLGEAVIVLDARGRVLDANELALRMAVLGRGAIVGRDVSVLGAEVAGLRERIGRGAATAVVTLPFGAAPVRARAVAVRVAGLALEVMVLRPEPKVRPPPLPRPEPAPDPGDAREAIGAVAASLRGPFGRATAAASYVRLLAPPLPSRAAEALASLERALEDCTRRIAAISSAQHGHTGALDLASIVADLVGAYAPGAGVRVRTSIHPARAIADDRPLRAAIREALRSVAGEGRDVAVWVGARGDAAVVEIAGGPGPRDDDGAAAIARALVAPLGGRVEEEVVPGHGRSVRIVLRGAPATVSDVSSV
jgi:hypothetical protein